LGDRGNEAYYVSQYSGKSQKILIDIIPSKKIMWTYFRNNIGLISAPLKRDRVIVFPGNPH